MILQEPRRVVADISICILKRRHNEANTTPCSMTWSCSSSNKQRHGCRQPHLAVSVQTPVDPELEGFVDLVHTI